MSDDTLPPLDEIKSCPFCGHVGLHFSEGSTFRWLAYSCAGCVMGSETRVQTMGDGSNEQWLKQAERDAIAEWNKRHSACADAAIERCALVIETYPHWLGPQAKREITAAIRALKGKPA